MREPSLEEARSKLGGRHLVSDVLEGRFESVRREQLVSMDHLLLSIETGMIQAMHVPISLEVSDLPA